jgi:hypothetical protein
MGWNARVWVPVTNKDGTTGEERKWIPLETHDEDLAKRKMTKIVALIATGGYSVDEMKRTALRVQTCREEMVSFVTSRRAAGVGMADDEQQRLTDYAMDRIGNMLVTHVKTRDIASLHPHAATLFAGSCRQRDGSSDPPG